MTTITIELRDDLAESLATEAQRRNMTVEQLAAIGIEKLLTKTDAEFEQIIEEIIDENRELYQHLTY